MDLVVWTFALITLHLIFLPFSIVVGKKLYLSGVLLSKIWGILWLSFGVWVLGSVHILPFSLPTILFVIFSSVILNGLLLIQRPLLFIEIKKQFKTQLLAESIFFIPFFFWVFLRGFNPSIDNFEKFMDFGFINAIIRSSYFPPQDMWFSGESINYYYFGHLVGAVLIRLTQVPSTIGYNLYMATVVGMSCTATFSIGASFVQSFSKNSKVIIFAGILTTLLVNFAGTLYTFSFIFQKPLEPFWFWRSIRLIPGAIHEFPQYSFAVSDLHAHMLNIPFVLLGINSLFILFTLLQKNARKEYSHYLFLLLHGWILGLLFMTSAWDLPIYLGLTGLTLFYIEVVKTNHFTQSVIKSLIQFLVVCFGVAVTVFLFWMKFDFSISQGVHLVYSHTQLIHYLTLWLPVYITLGFGLLFWIKKWQKENKLNKNILGLIGVFSLWGVFLTLVPEIIYIKDIYGGDFYRGNTILKFYYQAFIVLGIVSAVLLTKILLTKTSKLIKLFMLIPIVFWSACLLYPFQIIPSYYNNFHEWVGLDGSHFMKNYYRADHDAITWINQNIPNQSIILEAAGDSYTYHNRVSTFTGFPTVQGWFVHEWLWRGGAEKPGKRSDDVREIYESVSIERKKELLKNYNVDYIYIGGVERERYPNLTIGLLTEISETVFENDQVKIVKVLN